MAYSFGDGFDCYAAVTDAANGYWDSAGTSPGLTAGRFSGSQALNLGSSTSSASTKTSGVNDAVHHLCVAFKQTAAISGTTLGFYLQLLDGTNGQCAIVFRSDGAILLTSGSAAGATLATYTGAFPVTATWYQFEFEVIVNNTTGRFRVRKNGNNVDDFDSGATLNTRPVSTNNYANKLTIGMQAPVSTVQVDDLFWRSDASSVAWMGDIRCYTRMPASVTQAQFSWSPATAQFGQLVSNNTTNTSGTGANCIVYVSVTAPYAGTINSVQCSTAAALVGGLNMALYDATGTGASPGALLAQSTGISGPAAGPYTFSFASPPTVTKGQALWIALWAANSAASGVYNGNASGTTKREQTLTYTGTFPSTASSTASTAPCAVAIANIGLANGAQAVNEAQQDGTTSYVYSSNPGDADFYGIASISGTPSTVIAVTTRGYMQKSDAGTRTAAVQLKSGGTTVASPTLVLTTSGFQWTWRTDTTDPATSAAWTTAAVNNVTIGPKVIA